MEGDHKELWLMDRSPVMSTDGVLDRPLLGANHRDESIIASIHGKVSNQVHESIIFGVEFTNVLISVTERQN